MNVLDPRITSTWAQIEQRALEHGVVGTCLRQPATILAKAPTFSPLIYAYIRVPQSMKKNEQHTTGVAEHPKCFQKRRTIGILFNQGLVDA
jgi:hypothetical protein